MTTKHVEELDQNQKDRLAAVCYQEFPVVALGRTVRVERVGPTTGILLLDVKTGRRSQTSVRLGTLELGTDGWTGRADISDRADGPTTVLGAVSSIVGAYARRHWAQHR